MTEFARTAAVTRFDPHPSAPADLERAEGAARELLLALGADLDAIDMRDTPRRMATALAEGVTAVPFNMTVFPNDEGYDQLVIAHDIPFYSLCAHHVMPFQGVAHVGYLPGDHIVGLSKLGRIVEYFARGFQVQERLTQQIADWLAERLQPRGVGVVLEAEHLCMTLRGAQKPGTRMVTSALHGRIRHDARTREEFLALAGGALGRRL
jgi:GTP cyclohydrolase I